MYKNADQIYDEHIFIFSVTSIKKIFDLFDFQLIDTLQQKTHGGSMRYVLQRKRSNTLNKRVELMLEKEKRNHVDNLQGALNFKKNCEISKEKLLDKKIKIKKQKKIICGYGATSKSTTILNF